MLLPCLVLGGSWCCGVTVRCYGCYSSYVSRRWVPFYVATEALVIWVINLVSAACGLPSEARLRRTFYGVTRCLGIDGASDIKNEQRTNRWDGDDGTYVSCDCPHSITYTNCHWMLTKQTCSMRGSMPSMPYVASALVYAKKCQHTHTNKIYNQIYIILLPSLDCRLWCTWCNRFTIPWIQFQCLPEREGSNKKEN